MGLGRGPASASVASHPVQNDMRRDRPRRPDSQTSPATKEAAHCLSTYLGKYIGTIGVPRPLDARKVTTTHPLSIFTSPVSHTSRGAWMATAVRAWECLRHQEVWTDIPRG